MSILIPLTSRAGTVASALIDDADAHLARHCWCLSDGYAGSRLRLPDGSYWMVKW